ncbi:MAG TPA: hypothetical protein VJ841_03640 [Candidatus Saccharimonadales bacterium]|nr:hypothetical protein [Candidatus Saccharimonadales bacterium]
MADQDFEPPKTIAEMGIHLLYMRKAIDELTTSVKKSSEHYATKEEVKEGYVTKLEFQKLKSKTAPIIAGVTAVASVMLTAAAASLWNLIIGGSK